jgi:hypothetical protein
MTTTPDSERPSVFAGCAVGVGRLCVSWPIWYALLFGILQRIDAPTWMWVAYFVYVPSGLLLGVCEEVVKAAYRSGN